MTICLCGCAESEHELGLGACACGCPVLRPYRQYGPEEERHDRQHDGVAEAFMAEHQIRTEIHGREVWALLPDPPAGEGPFPRPAPLGQG